MHYSLIDSHCHLDSQYFPDGSEAVLNRAFAAGVCGCVTVGVGSDLQASQFVIELAARYPGKVAAAVGVHPQDAHCFSDGQIEETKKLVRSPSCVAVGEVGLDYYEEANKQIQKKVFSDFIGLAREVKKPLVIHTRRAAQDTLDLLVSEGAREVGGVIHCFTEDQEFASRVLDLGFYLSFSGIVTFKNAISLQQVASWAPLDRILLETDSPYLAPVPLRGKPCEPSYLIHTAKRVAELKKVDIETIAQATFLNTQQCFRSIFS
ncbi:TatD family hydrolase [Pajaroellobacter abortibovis]|uniref:Hydrolase TatD n=1 Tax=Pajaroellobacter abortibovis TaxID=1882918 RepID=A0A1L6MWW6_9BACT|nr:TatD family hydrolase [Pajaroellobacter abortibovis]APS00012.1 hydrolase TatD [Pajaroellobacter abortibovis]